MTDPISKHTPGPWYANDWTSDFGGEPFEIETRQAEVLAPGQSSIWPAGIACSQVATTRESSFESAVNIANARLIAAAPDLLIALSWLLEIEEKRPRDRIKQYPLAVAAARLVISKATGQP